MGQHIDQFCEDLRLKLTNIESGLTALKSKIDSRAKTAEDDVRSHLDKVKKRIEQGRAKVSSSEAQVRTWVEERKAFTGATIADWKARRQASELQGRADRAERYAAAAIDMAVAALDEAEEASLEAWLAREDANAVLAR